MKRIYHKLITKLIIFLFVVTKKEIKLLNGLSYCVYIFKREDVLLAERLVREFNALGIPALLHFRSYFIEVDFLN